MVRGRPNPLYFGLPARLKRSRENLSFNSVAAAAGLSDGNTIFQLERKPGHIPRIDTVERVAYGLGLSPSFLAYGIESEVGSSGDELRCKGVAGRLHATRTARGLTMRALARAAGLTDTAVRSTETGSSMPTLATVEAFANALGVSPGWLAYGIGPAESLRRRRTLASAATSSGKLIERAI